MNIRAFLAIGTLAGTIIGAGIFSLPYVFARLGLGTGIGYLFVFALVYTWVHLMYAQVAVKVPGKHQFFYFAEKHLPRFFSGLASFIVFGELVLVLSVYLILAPTFVSMVFGLEGLSALVLFWVFGSVFIFVNLRLLGVAELLGTLAIIGIVFLIIGFGSGLPLRVDAFRPLDWAVLFLPFGPLLFSLSGRPAISKIIEEHRKAQSVKKGFSLPFVVIVGTFLSALVYAFFVIGVLRLNPEVSPETLNSLSFLSPSLLVTLGVMGILTIWTSYFMIGINVRDILRFDLKWTNFPSALLVLVLPLGLSLFLFRDFLSAVSFTGGVFLALESIFVIWIWQRAFPLHKWRDYASLLYVFFVAAIAYEVSYFVLG